MQIIIVGCGKVGYTLVEQLNGEDHNIVVVDIKEERVRSITDELDAMGVVGNGASFQTLLEAGIKQADLLIAVTNSDEQNLLCCVIAKKAGNCKTIARVRNPIYNTELEFLRKELGLSEKKKTTDDLMFTVETVACLGACSSAPAITLNNEIYPTMTPESAVALVKSLKENG